MGIGGVRMDVQYCDEAYTQINTRSIPAKPVACLVAKIIQVNKLQLEILPNPNHSYFSCEDKCT